MRHWSFHYFSSLGLAISSAVLAMVVFRFKTQEGRVSCLACIAYAYGVVVECLLEIGQHPEEGETSERSAYSQIFGLRAVHLMAFFILIYVGYISHQEFSGLELNMHHIG